MQTVDPPTTFSNLVAVWGRGVNCSVWWHTPGRWCGGVSGHAGVVEPIILMGPNNTKKVATAKAKAQSRAQQPGQDGKPQARGHGQNIHLGAAWVGES